MSSAFKWDAAARPSREPEYDPNVVFANFPSASRSAQAGGMTESQARDRLRRDGRSNEDRMRGVVVEKRKRRTVREDEPAAAFRM